LSEQFGQPGKLKRLPGLISSPVKG